MIITMDFGGFAADGSITWENDPATTSPLDQWFHDNRGDEETWQALETLETGLVAEVVLGGGAASLVRLRVVEIVSDDDAVAAVVVAGMRETPDQRKARLLASPWGVLTAREEDEKADLLAEQLGEQFETIEDVHLHVALLNEAVREQVRA